MISNNILYGIAILIFTVGLIIAAYFDLNREPKETVQQEVTKYICSKNGVEYIVFDWRFMVLSVDQDGKPVKCTHE